MKLLRLIAAMVAFATTAALFVAPASAQATRTWISGVGDDVNPCSRTAPCKTFAGAISKTAACGEIDALDPGGFGAVTITKGITLDGGGGQNASILAVGTNGIVVNNLDATCTKVQIRNLSINGVFPSSNGSGINGVNVIKGSVSIEHTTIQNFNTDCVNFQPNAPASLVIVDSNLENCGNAGVEASLPGGGGVARVSVFHTSIEKNGIGFSALTNSDVAVSDSMIATNVGGGVKANGAAAQASLVRVTLTNNQAFGVYATAGGNILLSQDTLTFNNGPAMKFDTGGQVQSFSNNWNAGNASASTPSGTLAPQ